MKKDVKKFLVNLMTVILAMEIKSFFEKGGGSNDLAYSILKILFLSLFSVCIINMEDVTRVIIHQMDKSIPEGELGGNLSITKYLRAQKSAAR